MRHARPRQRSKAAVLMVMTPLAAAVAAGFVWGMVTAPSLSVLPAASAGTAPAQSAVATPVTVEPTPARLEPVASPAASPEALVAEDRPAAPTTGNEDWGDDYVDEEWPTDEKGDGCDAPVWPAAAPDADRVLLIGDSLFRNSRASLEESLAADGWVPTVRCWGAKGTDWGVGQVERARELQQLPQTVVLSFGTNDIWWLGISMEDAVDQMMDSLGSEREVYWINLWYDQTAYEDLPDPSAPNAILKAKTAEYPNLHIIDFASAFEGLASAGVDVAWTDGVHLNETANQLHTDLILAALG
jgi:hypothetical protein